MSSRFQKFVAVLLVAWLPLFSGAALAASVFMQMPHDACLAMMQHDQQAVHSNAEPLSEHHSTACDQCSICHLASGSYLGVQQIPAPDTLQVDGIVTPYLFSFYSITSVPLLPPPLV